MQYYSIFDRIQDASAYSNGAKTFNDFGLMQYVGTLGLVLDSLEEDTKKIVPDSRTLVRTALNAARIVRAAIDNKVKNPNLESEILLIKALDLALEIYKGSENINDKIREFRKEADEKLLNKELIQTNDNVTWEALRPNRSIETARRIVDRHRGEDVMMVALAHGGVAAGMDVFLRYCDLSSSKGSILYTARFSTQKLGDKEPRVTEREAQALRQLKEGKSVIIFDEDICSGVTISQAVEFFRDKVFGEEVETEVNLDIRTEFGDFYKKAMKATLLRKQSRSSWIWNKSGGLQIGNDHYAIKIPEPLDLAKALGPSIENSTRWGPSKSIMQEMIGKYNNFLFELNGSNIKPPKYFEKNLSKI